MALVQPIVNIAEICARRKVTQFILSPGSRCAPLTLAFVRHPHIQTRTISDERSAAFIAMGMAMQTGQTVGLVCTSGTAVLNYAPAITEAYYGQIPLLVLTADRPPEWIEQQDGQTIRQREVYGKHVKASFELPVAYTHPDAEWHTYRIINEAITISQTFPCGPVHINVPLREPLYPSKNETLTYDNSVRIIEPIPSHQILAAEQWVHLREMWEDFDKILIVAGQHTFHAELAQTLKHIQAELEIPVVADVISNLHTLPDVIRYADLLLMQKNEEVLERLRPQLLITFGNSVISKNLKLFLRKHKPEMHWHIQPAGIPADPFQSITHVLPVEPLYFFKTLFEDLDYQHFLSNEEPLSGTDYYASWQKENLKAAKVFGSLFNQGAFSEFEAVSELMDRLPDDCLLHLANSMSVRYANFIGLQPHQSVEVFANRGTSGIDGSTGTALGAALATDKLVILLTGDIAFLYDRNSLWHNYLPKNLRIIVLNNHGGGIFRLLDGPAGQPELKDYFETRQRNKAELTAKDAGLIYYYCNTKEELIRQFASFFDLSGSAQLLEIETNPEINAEVYAKFKKYLST